MGLVQRWMLEAGHSSQHTTTVCGIGSPHAPEHPARRWPAASRRDLGGNCSRCTARFCAPPSPAAPPIARQRLVPVPRRQQPCYLLPDSRRCAREMNRSSSRTAYFSSWPSATGPSRHHLPPRRSHHHSPRYRQPVPESADHPL